MSTDVVDGPRSATLAELPQVVAVVDSALRKGSQQTMLTDYPLVFRRENLENLHVVAVNGQVVAEVPFLPWTVVKEGCEFSFGHISPTATLEAHRKKGYGLLCLQDCIRGMNRLGCDLSVLWTRVETFPFYECGDYQAVQSQGWLYLLNKDDAAHFADRGDEVVAYDPANRKHLPEIKALHGKDTEGPRRSLEVQAVLLSLPRMTTLVALRRGRPAAYVIFSRATNKPGLVEGGGDDAAMETLVRKVLAEHVTDPIKSYAHLTEGALGRVLDRCLPGRRQRNPQGQMIRINNARAFLGKIRPWLERKNGSRERAFSVATGGDPISFRFGPSGLQLGTERLSPHFDVTPRELVSFVFGSHPARPVETPPIMADLFPFYFPIELLDHS